jgi:hypothetical protein
MKRMWIGVGLVMLSGVLIAKAQVATCDASGKQIVARRWDVVLGHQWEMVRDCRHPEWPARAQVTGGAVSAIENKKAVATMPAVAQSPILVHAGDIVALWQQAALVRIEMSGVAEQAARSGELVSVRVTHITAEGGMSVERLSGTVRAAGNVEMEP